MKKRKILGVTMIALPFVAMIIGMGIDLGWDTVLIGFGLPMLIAAMIIGGTYLLEEDEK